MAIETLIIQGETLTILDGESLRRTRTENPEKTSSEAGFDEFGIRENYVGEGYLDINGEVAAGGAKASGQFVAPEAGTYDIVVRLANGSSAPRSLTIDVDGVSATIGDTKTDSGWGWGARTVTLTLPEATEPRTITLSTSAKNGPNIDAIAIAESGTPVSFAAPVVETTALEMQENGTEVGQVVASDLDGQELTYVIANGADGALFTITDGGVLSFVEAPDFEANGSAAGGNAYEVEVSVTDGVETTTQLVTVNVTDDPSEDVAQPEIDQVLLQGEAGTIADPSGTPETFSRDQASTTEDASKREGEPGALKDGVPLDEFGLRPGYSGTGYLDFNGDGAAQGAGESASWTVSAPAAGLYALTVRYASTGSAVRPLDVIVNGQTQVAEQGFPGNGFNDWITLTVEVELSADDNTITLAIPQGFNNGPNVDAVAVTTVGEAADFFPPVNAAPIFDDAVAAVTVDEGADGVVADLSATDPDGDTVTYALSGDDGGDFTIDSDGQLRFATPPSFDEPADDGADNVYQLTVTATDGNGGEASRDVTVTVADVIEEDPAIALTAVAVTENDPGAVLADIAVSGVAGPVTAADLAVSDETTFRVIDGPNGPQLALADGVFLDFEAASQPVATVSLVADASVTADLTPAPTDDPADDPVDNAAPTAADGAAQGDEDAAGIVVELADLIADAEDADEALAVSATSAQGAVAVSGTTLTFTPAADFAGEASISYTVTDTGEASASGTIAVTVNAVDDAPTSVTLTPVAVAENAPGAVVAVIDVADVDGTASVSVDDTTNYRVIEEDGVLKLALAEGVSLDFEADAPAAVVTADGVSSQAFTPAPTDVDDGEPEEGGPVAVTFDTATVAGYSSQDKPGTGAGVTVSPDGSAITLDGNLWKRVPLAQDYEITADTRIELAVAIGATVPEIVGIGFDDDENPFNGNQALYQLGGTQSPGSFTNLSGTGAGGRFVVDLSAHAGKTISSLVLIADDDIAPFGSATFADVRLVEASGPAGDAAPRVVGGGVADLTLSEGGAVEVDLPFVEDDGDAVTLGFTVADADGNAVTVEGLGIVDGALVGPAPTAPGVYTVTLTATDKDGTASDEFLLTVEDVNDAPVASDAALEPYFGTAGQAIDGIDLSGFVGLFTDPEGQDLTITAEGLPAGLRIEEGFILGTPTGGGQTTATIRATDPGGLSDTIEIVFDVQGGQIGDVTTVEAEDFTGLGSAKGFFATGQAGASDDQIIRSSNGVASEVTTDLAANGLVEGWYRVAMTRYDETDGSATYSLRVGDAVLAANAAFDEGGSFDNANARGAAGQSGNLKTVVYDTPVFVTAGTILTLSGTANGELLRTDKFTFTRIEEPNQAPSTATLDASTVAENADGAVIGTLSATDPDGDAVTFSVDAASPFEVDGATLKLKAGESLDYEEGATVSVDVTATDGKGGSSVTTLLIAVTDVDEAPGAPVLTTDGPVAENAAGAVIGTLSALDDASGGVTFTVADPRFVVVGQELRLADGVALDFETDGASVAVSVTANDGTTDTAADVTVAVADVNDAPTLADGAALADAAVAFGAGGTIDLSVLGASDQDAGDTVAYGFAGADGTTLPEGFAISGTDLVVPADAPAGAYEVEVFATDGEADSESVSFTVTVGEAAPFEPISIQAEAGTIALAQAADGQSTQIRDADNPETGGTVTLRPDFTGTGYVDYGNDAGDTLTFTVNVTTAGQYDLNVRYASATLRPLDLAINGTADATPLAFTSTDPDGAMGDEDGFDHWEFLTRTVTLEPGDNTISLAIPAGAKTGPNLDRIEITEAGTGPIPAVVDDTTADEGDDLAATSPTVAADAASAVAFELSGVDADIVLVEASVDGGAFAEVTATDGVVTLDLSAFAAGSDVPVQFRVTDGVGNEALTSATATIGTDAPVDFSTTIQLENRDGSITITDTTGTGEGDPESTQFRDLSNVESVTADRPQGLWPGYEGDGYLDMGANVGDQASFTVDVPAAGDYTFSFRYGNGSTAQPIRPLAVAVDGAVQATPDFEGNGDWTVWQTETVTLTLKAGANVVSLTNTVDNGPNLDSVTITPTGAVEDTSADEGDPLFLDGPTGELNATQAASINFNVTGDDDDIVLIEISFDGGTTRVDVTAQVDADGDFVVDGSNLAPGAQTATLTVTDAAGNEASTTRAFSIAAPDAGAFDPVTIQAEDETQATVIDTGTGNTDRSFTRVVDAENPDAFGNFRPGAVGDEYVDFGSDAGDAIAFSLTVPTAGTYTATIRYANGGAEARPLAVSVNDGAASNVSFAPTGSGDAGWENWTDVTVDLTLAAGANTVTLTIPTAANGGVANGPNIDQITFASKEEDGGDTGGGTGPDGRPADAEVFAEVVRVNFEAPKEGNGAFNAPASYTTPEGFEADTGEAFGDRGNGFSYGWVDIDDASGTVTDTPKAQPTGSMRYKNAASEASDLQKTYAHFEYPGANAADRERAWEIALENGVYELTVAIGDTAGQYDSDYVINVEGQPFGPSFEPVNNAGEKVVGGAYSSSLDGEGFRSNLYTGIVTVTDGRLTIDSLGGENTEIQWLDIERVPDLTPNDDRSADLDYSKFVAGVAASLRDGQVSIELGPNGDVPLDIDPTSSLVVGVQLQAIDHRGPNVVYTDRIKLVETLTGDETPINVQVTGGADSLTIKPLAGLKENTSYTLVIDDVLDLGDLTDADAPLRQFQDYTTTFVTGEAPEVVARDVAFTDRVILDGFPDGGAAYTSIEFGPDGRLYVTTITGEIHRWDVASDGSIDKTSKETLSLDYFQDTGRSIIGIAFDPEDAGTIWVTDNAPVPREGKAQDTPEFSGQVSKITLGAGGSFAGAEAEAYITGLPRSGGDHVTNSLEFRANPDAGQAGEPDHLLYVTQGSNSAAGRPDNAWGFRPERLLNAAALEIDPRRDAPQGGFDVQTEPYDPSSNDPTFRTGQAFNDDGTVNGFYDPFASDAVLKIYGEGIRNAYDLVWHSNGFLYTPTNGTARGGNTLDDPSTAISEQVGNLDKQFDYLFQVQEGGYYGHPNSLLEHYVVNGGAGGPDNIYGSDNAANTNDNGNEYAAGVVRDDDYDIDGAYSLGFNQSPNGAIEYTGDAFGPNLKGALLFAQFSTGDNVRVINVDPVTGRVTGDDVLRRPGGDVIDDYIDPLDIIQNPVTGQLYLMTLNRGSGESKIVLLTPAPGGVTSDVTADEGNDLALVVVDDADASAVVFRVDGLDDDIVSVTVAFDGGTPQPVTLNGSRQFTRDLSDATGQVTATLAVADGAGNKASAATALTLGDDGGAGDATIIDATEFTVLSTLTGTAATVIRRIDDPATYENPNSGNDVAPRDGLNDGYDGIGYLDPNGGAEDKASFVYDAPGAGTYSLVFRMAANNDRSVAIQTGDQSVPITVNTATFTNWADFPVTLTLTEGPNTIVIAQTSGQGPNIDSVTVTPIDVEVTDDTADEGGDLALTLVNDADPAAVVFAVAGLDADITSLSVSFDGGATSQPVVLENGQFSADLSGVTGDVTAVLTVGDGTNTATAQAGFTLADDGVANDGTETVGGVDYVIYEAESASLSGDPAVVTSATADRGQRGDEFVDFLGPNDDETITWTVEVPEDGTYAVDVIYALAAGKGPRPMALSVDGTVVTTLQFPSNSDDAEDDWGPEGTTLSLAAGVHTISVEAPGGVGPNVDYLRISSAPVDVFEPTYAGIDGEGRIELEAADATTRTVDGSEVEFYFTVAEGGVYALDVAANAGAPDGAGLTFLLNGAEIGSDDFPGQGDAGEETVYATLEAGAQYKLTIVSDQPGASALDYLDVRAAPGDPNADIEVQSLDPAYFDDRLHFSWLDERQSSSKADTDRDFKESATVRISNSGTADLDVREATLTGPFELADPTAFDGLTLGAGESIDVTVLFDRSAYQAGGNGVTGVFEGALAISTNDADTPVATVDLAGFWQARDEGGQEPNVNEVWDVFGFGNVIEGLSLLGGGENSVLDFFDVYLPVDETEVLSPYWRIADGVTEARITQIAAYHGPGGAPLGIHAPGNKDAQVTFSNHGGDQNQTILPLKGNGAFATATFTNQTVPDAWAGTDIFGIEMANLSTDPTLNPTGSGAPSQSQLNALYPGYTVQNGTVFDPQGNEVPDGYTVRMFRAVDQAGEPIPNVYLGVMDYTGINYDYNDNMFVVEGVAPVFFGGSVTVSGLDDAAADDRLVFTNIDNPANGSQLFRNEATITLTNDGLGAASITGLTFGGADAAAFEIVGDAPTTIPEGGSAQVTVRFTGSDPVDDNAAVLLEGTLTVETGGGTQQIALAGLAQNQSEKGEEPSVAQIVEAFGYTTDVAQGELAAGGVVETVGDEVLLPYLERLDGSKPVEVIQLAAFLNQGNVARLSSHSLDSSELDELFAADDQQGQTILPDGLVPGTGDTGTVARAAFAPDGPFGLKVTVDGRPTYASWTDPEANKIDPDFGQLVGPNQGHLIRFFEAKDAAGNVIPGTYIGIQDYPGAGNYDYNDHMFVVKNVKAHALTAAEDANGDGVNDALQTDADNDGKVAFFDADDTPVAPVVQTAFNNAETPWAVQGDGLTLMANLFDEGGQGVAYNDDGTKSGDQSVRPGTTVDISNGTGAIGYTNAGEWIEYTINVAQAGEHTLTFNSSSPSNGRTLTASFEKDGSFYETVTAQVPNTGSYTSYADTQAVTVTLQAGVQVVRVNFDLAQQDLMSFSLAPVTAPGNQAPVAGEVPDATFAEGASVFLDAGAAFTDPDDDALTFSATGLPSGLAIDPATGQITGTAPQVGADAEFSVTVTATDPDGASDSDSFTFTVADVPVTADPQQPFPGPDAAGFAGGVLNVDASNYDQGGQGVAYNDTPGLQGGTTGGRPGSDVEQTGLGDVGWIDAGEWLEYTIEVPAAGLYDLDLLLATNGGPGRTATVTFTAAGASAPYASTGPIANPVTGGWTTFAERSADGIALQAGTQVVRVAFDGGSQDFRSFTLTAQEAAPANQAPVAGTIPAASVDEGTAISIDVSGAFSDPDDDPLGYTVSGLAGLSISSSGLLTGTAPQVGADTDYVVTVTASDGSLSGSSSFTLSVEDVPVAGPVQTPFPGSAPKLGQSLTVDATNFDAGGQGVSWNDDPGLDGGDATARMPRDVELFGGQLDLAYVEKGDWVEYTIDVAEAGTYDLSLVAKTPIAGNSVTVSVEGGPALAKVALPDSNGASTSFGGTAFAPTAPVQVELGAGQQTLRFAFDGAPASNGYLLDMRSFSLDRVETVDPEPPVQAGAIGQAGTVTVTQANAGQWSSVQFDEALQDAAVVMGPISFNGGQASTMRVRNVTETGFEYQLDEWNYLDGAHTKETVSWMAIEKGVHSVGGQTIVAGVGQASEAVSSIGFGPGAGFGAAPVVTAQVTSTNDPDAVVDRISGVTAQGFKIQLDDEEANNTVHAQESLAWIAMEKGGSAASGLLAATTGDRVTHQNASIDFGGSFADEFVFVADTQTRDGSDPANLRLKALTKSGATIAVHEEQSADVEINHTTEDAGYMAITKGLIFADDLLG